MSCSPGQTKVSAVHGRPWSGIPLFSEVLQFSIKGKQRSLTFSGNRIHFMLLIIRLILFSLTHLGLQLWQEKLASTPRARLKERWKGTLEEIEYDKSERQSMGDCVKSGLGTTLCKYGMYILKVRHPQVLKSWWAFSYFHFVSSFCRSIYHSVVSWSSRFTISSFRFVVLALELRWTVNNSAVIHIDSMLREIVGQFARIPATLPESWSGDFIPWLFSPF